MVSVRCRRHGSVLPACGNQTVGEPVRMVDECRKTLRTDIVFLPGQTQHNDRKFGFRSTAVEAGSRLVLIHKRIPSEGNNVRTIDDRT
jgi:hypothetical protein